MVIVKASKESEAGVLPSQELLSEMGKFNEQLVKAGKNLDQLNVPSDARWAIVTPFFKSLLMQDTKYLIRATDMGDAIIRTANIQASDASRVGFIGQCAGFDVFMSNNVPTNATYWANSFGQGKPVCYAAQIPPSTIEALRLETTFATRVRGLLLEGAKVFTEDAKRLGVMSEGERPQGTGPVLVKG